MRLRTRIAWLAGIGLLLVGSISLAVGSQFVESRHAAAELTQELQPAASAADRLVREIANMDRALSGYVLTEKTAELGALDAATRTSAAELETARSLLQAHEFQLVNQVNRVETSRQLWLRQVRDPTVAAMLAGDKSTAAAVFSEQSSDDIYDALEGNALTLQGGIEQRKAEQFEVISALSNRTLQALIASMLVLVVGVVLEWLLIGAWVLKPIDALRSQLRDVARERRHEAPIQPAGPPEIHAVSEDAEEMRRQLVAEIDEARAAREGLAQESPVVTAIRAELDRGSRITNSDVHVYGELHPAEGVLAGDWWDATKIGPHRIAIAVADVSGHGATAGIAGLRLKTEIMSMLRAIAAGANLLDFTLASAAQLFTPAPEQFATCVVVVIDSAQRSVSWMNAGHHAPVILHPEQRMDRLDPTGPLLSTLGGDWKWESISIESEDIVMIWTDGLSESRDQLGQQLDESGVLELAGQAIEKGLNGPTQLVPEVLNQARHRSIDWRRDDVTLIAATLGG